MRRVDEPAPASELQTLTNAALEFRTAAQTARDLLDQQAALIRELESGNALAGEARVNAIRAAAPRYDAFLQDYFRLGETTRAQQRRFELCTEFWAEMVEKIRTRY